MLCERTKDTGMNAPPTRLPNLVPFALISRLCLRLASALRLNHFVVHDSGRADLPRFPCLLPTPCERGTHLLLADCKEIPLLWGFTFYHIPVMSRVIGSQRVTSRAYQLTLGHLSV
jgi:hypothetical protein